MFWDPIFNKAGYVQLGGGRGGGRGGGGSTQTCFVFTFNELVGFSDSVCIEFL